MQNKNFEAEEYDFIFAATNSLSEINRKLLEEWKEESKKDNWNGLLIFKNQNGYYHIPFDTKEEMVKTYDYFGAIDSFIAKVDL